MKGLGRLRGGNLFTPPHYRKRGNSVSRYFCPGFVFDYGGSYRSLATGLSALPFVLPWPLTINQAGFHVSGLGSKTHLYYGFYGTNMRACNWRTGPWPGNLLWGSADDPVSWSGFHTQSVSPPLKLPANQLLWMAYLFFGSGGGVMANSPLTGWNFPVNFGFDSCQDVWPHDTLWIYPYTNSPLPDPFPEDVTLDLVHYRVSEFPYFFCQLAG